MSQLEILISDLAKKAENPRKTINESMAANDKNSIGCLPIYAPEELIYAAGYIPVGLWGGNIKSNKSSKYYPQFCCSIVRADTELAMNRHYDMLDAIIPSAFCDTLKCAIEIFKTEMKYTPVLPFVYPQNRKTKAGKDFMIEEYQRLQKELESLSGKKVTDEKLRSSLEVYKEYRKAMREFTRLAAKHTDLINSRTRHNIIKAAYFMDKKEYTQLVKQINAGLQNRTKNQPAKGKVVLTGLMSEPAELLDILNQNDLYVVADDLAQESRQFRTADNDMENVYESLAERLSMQDGCTFLYDSHKYRIDEIKKLVKDNDADFVIFLQMKFCDPDEFDYPIIEKALKKEGISVLYIETEQQVESLGQLTTRIQGFKESRA